MLIKNIEEAPKDGTNIFTLMGNRKVVAYWRKNYWASISMAGVRWDKKNQPTIFYDVDNYEGN